MTSSIAQYLLSRLNEQGLEHIFGVPGDYVLRFYDEISKSAIQHIGTTREDTAAFAADGYARCKGIGALAVTYGVGALNVVNAVAGAHAESSPVVVISGAPGLREQREDPLIHHRFGPFSFQREIFERITCAAVVLDDPVMAFRQIDRALAALRRACLPIYIELPRDLVTVEGFPYPAEAEAPPVSDPETLDEAVAETLALLAAARAPVLLAGLEVHRQGLQDALMAFIERTHLPVAATLTGKSVVAERHPAYLGVYEGAMSSDSARRAVEQADLALMLGVTLNDVDLGIYTARLNPEHMVRAAQGEVVIRHHRYAHVALGEFLAALAERVPSRPPQPVIAPWPEAPDFPCPNCAMTSARLDRPAQCRADAGQHGGLRYRRLPVRGDGVARAQGQRVLRFGLLHQHGLRRTGCAGRAGGAAEIAGADPGGRRRLPDDRHRTFHHRAAWPGSHRDRVQQLRLQHRALHPGRAVQ